MKKILIIILVFLPLAAAFSQIDTIADNIYGVNGNLGIGTTCPEVKLRIEADIPGGNNQALIRLRNKSTDPSASVSLGLEANDALTSCAFSYTSKTFTGIPDLNDFNVISTNGRGFAVYTTKPNSSIRFYTNMDANGILERMRITGDGSVGVGTNAPSYKLDVAGLINTSQGIRFPDGSIQSTAASGVYFSPILTPERIHIGDTSLLPALSDGPVKIVTSNNLSYGVMLLKNPASNLCTAIDFYNNKNTRLTVGIAGSENPNFYRNCGYIFMSDQNSDEPAAGLVIGHRYSTAPIIFAQNNEEVLRIDNNGNMGVGTNTPYYKLDVAGLINTSEGIRFPDGTIQNSAAASGSSDWLKNGYGNLYTLGNIGIGTSDPEVKLRIEADIPGGNNQALIRLKNTSTDPNASVSLGLEANDGINSCAFSYTSSTFTGIPDLNDFNVISTNGRGFAVYTTKPNSSIRFYTNMDENGIIERMRITGDGYVGIGTNSPKAKVEVADGDIYISDINKGIIMKSPDGQCWRGTLDNSGILSFVAVNCEDLTSESMDRKSADRMDLSIFPNPVQNTVTIASQQYNLKNMTAILYTIDGKIAKKEKLFSEYAVLKLNDIPEGTYIIKVVNKKGEEIGSEKIIKN